MDVVAHYGLLSILPAIIAVVLAFVTREATFALLVACGVGVLIIMVSAGDLNSLTAFQTGLNNLFQNALGNGDFIWVLGIEVFIGVLVAFFQISGSTQGFSAFMDNRVKSRKMVQVTGWLLGMFIFFSDYFSPLFVGPVMQKLTDKAKISREKLAYICDSTSAPMCVMIPITSCGVYLTGLLVGIGPIVDLDVAMGVFGWSVFYNFYGWIAIGMVGLIAIGLIPEFGPMKKAEKRAMEEGKVIADGAVPMMGVELSDLPVHEKLKNPSLVINFLIPVGIIIAVALGSYIFTGSTPTLEAFITADIYLGIVLCIQGVPMKDLFSSAMQGIKGVVPAIVILALAYCINAISSDLGAAAYVIEMTQNWLTPTMLPMITYLLTAFIAFSTGTSWGTYAIMIPIAVPLALTFSGGELTPLVYASVAAVAGGGVFGDHCSPLSDTTILSSFGAGSDHIDHVKTQLPYALCAAVAALLVYFVIGIIW